MDLYAITSQQVLDRVSRHCPEALSLYLQCINRADKDGKVYFSRVDIECEMSETWTKFKNRMKMLAKEDLLEWHFRGIGIQVTLAALDDD